MGQVAQCFPLGRDAVHAMTAALEHEPAGAIGALAERRRRRLFDRDGARALE